MPGALVHTLLSLNGQWEGFGSTRREVAAGQVKPWPQRLPLIVAAIRRSGASIVSTQELGQLEMEQVADRLGSHWWRQRKTLNGHLWHDGFWDLDDPPANDSRDLVLADAGQWPGRSAIACRLVNRTGQHFFPISTHLAVGKAGLSYTAARALRRKQAQQIAAKFDAYSTGLIVGDFNEAGEIGGPRAVLTKQAGFRFLELSRADRRRDAHHGIDAVGAQPGVRLLSHTLQPLGAGSDHDGQLVTFTLAAKPNPA